VISIILADDHPVVRNGLYRILEANNFARITGEASTGEEAMALIESLKPSVAIVDIVMAGMNGLELTRLIKKTVPDTRVIVLSMYSQENYVLEALKNGADGYVVKDSSALEIVLAVQTVMEGKRYLSPRISQAALDAYVQRARKTVLDPCDTLTNREREVLTLSVQGLSSREIGEKLSISPRTVETHRENLMRKLGLSGLPALISYALQKGLAPEMYQPK
jgi:two-component system, NarL family, response regulator NreC